jgi:hypothetical protein
MRTNVASEIGQIFEDWQLDHQKLAACIDEIRDWMAEVNQLGIPHFGETASRLQPLRTHLQSHFEREDRILKKLSDIYAPATPEVEAFTRQTNLDHHSLMMRLEDLYSRLKQIEPPFESWTAAMDEVDVFFEAMQQHELQESDRVSMLIPRSDG